VTVSDDEVRTWREKAEAERMRRSARHAVLMSSTDVVVRAVAELHEPVFGPYRSYPVCEGCDMDGYECEPAEWPCRTWVLLDETVE
jgi:hypothetical protein